MAVNKLGIFSDPLLDRQIREIVAELTPRDWITPELLNGWTALGGSNNPAGYYKHLGRVYFRGMISGGTINTTAFVLPDGYRPLNEEKLGTVSYGPTGPVAGRLDVYPNGNVTPAAGSSTWFSLDGLSFRVA